MNISTILAPTDLQDSSLRGLETAADLARSTGARLVVITVLTSRDVDTTVPSHTGSPVRSNVAEDAEAQIAAQVAGLAGDIDTETRVVWGDPVQSIMDAAAEIDADVIVITGKHRSRVGKALLGSQAQRLILESDRPILTVPTDH